MAVETFGVRTISTFSENSIIDTVPELTDGIDVVTAKTIMDTIFTAITAYQKALSVEQRANGGEFKGDTGATGKGLEFNWNGTQLGVRIQGQTAYQYVNLKGATGNTPDFSIGTVTTVEPNVSASASITGSVENPILNLSIPKGQKGDTGERGETGQTGASPTMLYDSSTKTLTITKG